MSSAFCSCVRFQAPVYDAWITGETHLPRIHDFWTTVHLFSVWIWFCFVFEPSREMLLYTALYIHVISCSFYSVFIFLPCGKADRSFWEFAASTGNWEETCTVERGICHRNLKAGSSIYLDYSKNKNDQKGQYIGVSNGILQQNSILGFSTGLFSLWPCSVELRWQ